MRGVFVVGSSKGGPFEVWALFTTRAEAERHVKLAAYDFDVFALPVYERYTETPPALRPAANVGGPRPLANPLEDELALTAEALDSGELEPVAPGHVIAVGGFDASGLPEVQLLFSDRAGARAYREEALAWYYARVDEQAMTVFGSYEECPPEARYAEPGPALSQHVRPRS